MYGGRDAEDGEGTECILRAVKLSLCQLVKPPIQYPPVNQHHSLVKVQATRLGNPR